MIEETYTFTKRWETIELSDTLYNCIFLSWKYFLNGNRSKIIHRTTHVHMSSWSICGYCCTYGKWVSVRIGIFEGVLGEEKGNSPLSPLEVILHNYFLTSSNYAKNIIFSDNLFTISVLAKINLCVFNAWENHQY